MKARLAVFDVSAYVHTGMNEDSYKNYKVSGFPVGGIKYFLKYLSLELSKNADVVCAFDSRSFRKDLDPTYKEGRVRNPAIHAQCNLLYNLLQKCGIACYKVDTFEADDIIYNAVKQNKHNYLAVDVFGVDYDLTHNVDEGKVRFRAVNSNVNSIDVSNFCFGIKQGVYIHFNTISAFKVLNGDNSDNISAFKSVKGYKGSELYSIYVKYLESQNPQLSSTYTSHADVFRAVLKALNEKLTEEDYVDLETRIKKVYPAEMSETFTPSNLANADKALLTELISAVDEYPALRSLRYSRGFVSESTRSLFYKLGKELETGEYAVDKSKEVVTSVVESTPLFMREF